MGTAGFYEINTTLPLLEEKKSYWACVFIK